MAELRGRRFIFAEVAQLDGDGVSFSILNFAFIDLKLFRKQTAFDFDPAFRDVVDAVEEVTLDATLMQDHLTVARDVRQCAGIDQMKPDCNCFESSLGNAVRPAKHAILVGATSVSAQPYSSTVGLTYIS